MSSVDISRDGIVETYAGVPGTSGSTNGPRVDSSFSGFWSCALAPNGGIYIGDFSNHSIRLIDGAGMVTTYAGTGISGFANGHRRLAQFANPSSMFLCEDGSLLVSDKNNHRVRRIGAPSAIGGDQSENAPFFSKTSLSEADVQADQVVTVAGTGLMGYLDGPCSLATFNSPVGIVECSMGVLVADWQNHRLRLISGGIVSTFAGTGVQGMVNGTRLNALFSSPTGLCVNQIGEVYVADRNNHRIRVIRTNGEVEDFSGSGERGAENGPGPTAKFTYPWALSISPFGDVIVADEYNHLIRVVDPNGIASTLAGTGEKSHRDGNREVAAFAYPACTALSPQGYIYIADRDNYCLRRMFVERWATEAVANYKKLSLLGLKDAEALADLSLPLQTHASWKLHSPVIAMRCPQLMEKPIQEKMQKLDIATETIEGLIHYIYDNHIPKLSLSILAELDVLADILQMGNFALFIRADIRRRLSSHHTVDELLELLKHVVTRCGNATHLVDLIMSPLRNRRSQVALKLPLISAWIAPTDPIFLEIVGKLMGDFPLTELADANVMVADDLQRELLGLHAQLEAIYARESSSSEASSSNDQPLSTATHSSQASKGFANWWEPDFAFKLDGREFKCHKWIVCGRWTYMREAMIFGGREAETAVMELPIESFVSHRLLQAFIRYLYTNEVEQFDVDADCIGVLRLAREFRLIDSNDRDVLGFGVLLDHCRSKLVGPLTLGSCIPIYQRVRELGSEDQQISVRAFLLLNMASLASDPVTKLQLEALDPKELVTLLWAQSRTKPERSDTNFW